MGFFQKTEAHKELEDIEEDVNEKASEKTKLEKEDFEL